MVDISNNKKKANELRKKGDIDLALPLYQQLWETTQDKYAVAGMVFCYRKQRKFEEAIPLAEEAYNRFPDFDWCRNEYIWTLIQGRLYTFPDDGELSDLISIVNKILEANPDEIAFKVTVLKLLKNAKKHNNWEVLNEWITKIEPNILDGYTDESSGWTDRELWYYYRVNGLINSNNDQEAIDIIENNGEKFSRQVKFFERLKAKAYINLGNYDEAEKTYRPLIATNKDWWLLHEYGKLLLRQGKHEEALIHLISAARTPPMKLELKVSLFTDIGDLLMQSNRKGQALAHFHLAKAVREEHGWSVRDLNEKLSHLTNEPNENKAVKSMAKVCKEIWLEYVPKETPVGEEKFSQRNLRGKIISFDNGRPFCFIKTDDKQTFFCSKDDLRKGSGNNTTVKFDLIPSFDKKKGTKAFKAANVSIVS